MTGEVKGWDDISIDDFNHIKSLYEIKEEGLDKQMQDYKNNLRVYAFVADIPFEEFLDMKKSEGDRIKASYSWVDSKIVPKKPKEWNGMSISYNVNTATSGQFIDIMSLHKRGDVKLEESIASLLSGWTEPDFQKRVEYVRNNMPITIALGINSFFLRRLNLLLKLFPKYLKFLMKMEKRRTILRLRWTRFKQTFIGSNG